MRTNMNKKFFIYIFFFVPILCASCDRFNESDRKQSKDVKTIEVFPDSVRQYLIEQDSLKRGLISMIDTLTTELNSSKNEIEQLQSEIVELKSPGRLLAILVFLSLTISFVAIILSIIRTNNKVERWEVKDMTRPIVKEHVKDLEYRMNRAENNIKEIGKDSSTSKTTSVDSFTDKRVSDLELRLNRIERNNNNTVLSKPFPFNTHSSADSRAAQEPEKMKIGYAKVNSNKYFVEIYDSKQEDCVYIIKFISKEEGEFDIISLDKIKSINGLKEVVELTQDSCLLEEATNYIVMDKGRCRKADETVWEVTKKLIIKVTK